MRLLTVFVLSLIVCLFGILFVALPQAWMIQPWQSPLTWGGAVVFSTWMFSIRSLSETGLTRSPVLAMQQTRGAIIVTMAGAGTLAIMQLLTI